MRRSRIDLGGLGVTVVSGRRRPRDLIRVRNWAVQHRAALYENWNRARRKQALLKIED